MEEAVIPGSGRALQDAASVASLLITTEAMIAEKPKDKSPSMPGGIDGGMGGMDF
jgi:chaperonin GroEL